MTIILYPDGARGRGLHRADPDSNVDNILPTRLSHSCLSLIKGKGESGVPCSQPAFNVGSRETSGNAVEARIGSYRACCWYYLFDLGSRTCIRLACITSTRVDGKSQKQSNRSRESATFLVIRAELRRCDGRVTASQIGSKKTLPSSLALSSSQDFIEDR